MTKRASGAQFAALMDQYGLRCNQGSALIAKLLDRPVISVQGFYSRGLPINELKLLKYQLKEIAVRSPELLPRK